MSLAQRHEKEGIEPQRHGGLEQAGMAEEIESGGEFARLILRNPSTGFMLRIPP